MDNEKKGLMPKTSDWQGHDWASRDHAMEILCGCTACRLHDGKNKCGLPSHFGVGQDGRCTGFTPQEIKEVDGD